MYSDIDPLSGGSVHKWHAIKFKVPKRQLMAYFQRTGSMFTEFFSSSSVSTPS